MTGPRDSSNLEYAERNFFRDDDVGVVTRKLISERSNQEILLDGICRESEGSFNNGKLCYKNV